MLCDSHRAGPDLGELRMLLSWDGSPNSVCRCVGPLLVTAHSSGWGSAKPTAHAAAEITGLCLEDLLSKERVKLGGSLPFADQQDDLTRQRRRSPAPESPRMSST